MKDTKIKENPTEKKFKKSFDLETEHENNITEHPIKNYKNAVVVTTQKINTKPKHI